jgi:transposase
MLKVENYARIRRAHRDGMSIREIARTFHRSRRKIREVLKNPEPRPYTRSKAVSCPKLTEDFQRVIEDILKQDEEAPRKQRHTASAIFRRLVSDGYEGSYHQVRRFVAKHRRNERETFIPLCHDPGQRAEADFGHIYVDFPEGRQQVAVLIITWAYSNATFAIAVPSEKVESILYGTVEAFEFFGVVPKELWWDNPKTVAKSILKGRQRELNDHYLALSSHYNFEPLFCMPAKGNEKPHVENRVKLLQRWWATPVPRVANLDELNDLLRRRCQQDQQRTVTGRSESIETRFAHERALAIPLPARRFDTSVPCERKVDKYQIVVLDKNRYSVPRRYAFQTVTVKSFTDRIEIVSLDQTIARHERCYGQGEQVLDPLHYLVTLGRKPACLDHTDVYRSWRLPADFTQLRQELEARHGRLPGARQYIRVLQLLAEHPLDRVRRAIVAGRREGVVAADAIRNRCSQWQVAESLGAQRNTSDEQQVSTAIVPSVQVPLPDLSKFDRLLIQGGPEDDQHPTRSTTAFEGESQAASLTNYVGRVHQVGTGGSRERPGLLGLLAQADGIGIEYTCGQCAAGPDQASGVSSPQGFGNV